MEKISIETRREWAAKAIIAYSEAKGDPLGNHSTDEVAIDLITDVLHLAAEYSGLRRFRPGRIPQIALMHFEEERGEP